jgi:hypothetical protein
MFDKNSGLIEDVEVTEIKPVEELDELGEIHRKQKSKSTGSRKE